MLFYYAISKGEIALTGSLWATYPVTTVLLSFLFLHEKISFFQIYGIFFALMGVFLISLPEKKIASLMTKNTSWIWWGSIGAVMSGAGDFLSKVATNSIGAYSQIFFLSLFFQILSVINFIFDKKGRKLPHFSFIKFFPTIIAAFFTVCGSLVFLLSLNIADASVVVPVSSVYPGITVLLAMIFLKEKISKKQLIGIFLIITSVIFLGLRK
jgi:transporter family protein